MESQFERHLELDKAQKSGKQLLEYLSENKIKPNEAQLFYLKGFTDGISYGQSFVKPIFKEVLRELNIGVKENE